MTTIASELESLSIGTPQQFRHLTVFPLVHPTPRAPFYLTLDEALAQGTVQVTEVSKGGHVPELLLINRGDRPVLLIECPRILFPFARRIIADVTRDGGFPPLFLNPIDFVALYRRQFMLQESPAAGQA